jgi:hypothetical protein
MNLEIYRHLWGVDDAWEIAVPRFKARGYVGLETWLRTAEDRARIAPLLKAHDLKLIAQVISGADDHSVAGHLQSFEQQLEECADLKPEFVNVHAGEDWWNDVDTERFFKRALEIAEASGIAAAFETHRGRSMYTPWRTMWLLERFPTLRLACDFSHWVTVCERLLHDQGAAIAAAARACIHIHARVGHAQGPQVPDPRDPYWKENLETHESWWDQIWAAQKARGDQVTTLTPEFGPPDYLNVHPFTREPLANLEEVCDWMADRQRERFKASLG